jgi:LysM repeat protein
MRRGLWKSGILLVAVAMVLGGLAGCTRPAAVREGGSATAETPSGEDEATPAPGQTVVSAVTSTPTEVMVAVDEQPTSETVEQATVGAAVTPEPPATEAAESATVTDEQAVAHIVEEGETLTAIAEQYETSVQAIRESNDLGTSDAIFTGQKLTIPSSDESANAGNDDSAEESSEDSSEDSSKESSKDSSSESSGRCRHKHTVKKGEWVWQIAREYGVSPYKILQANNLTIKKAKIIHPGKVLCIP